MTPYTVHTRGHIWCYVEIVLRKVRHYMIMLGRFIRRFFGFSGTDRETTACTTVVSVSDLNVKTEVCKFSIECECTVDINTINKHESLKIPRLVKRNLAQVLNKTSEDTNLTKLDLVRKYDCERWESQEESSGVVSLIPGELADKVRELLDEYMLVVEKKHKLAKRTNEECQNKTFEAVGAAVENTNGFENTSLQCLCAERNWDDSCSPIPEHEVSHMSASIPLPSPSTTNNHGFEDADNEQYNSYCKRDPSLPENGRIPPTVRKIFDYKAHRPFLFKTDTFNGNDIPCTYPFKCNMPLSPPERTSKRNRSGSPYPRSIAMDMVLTNAPIHDGKEPEYSPVSKEMDLEMKQKKSIRGRLQPKHNKDNTTSVDLNGPDVFNHKYQQKKHVVTMKDKYTYTLETYATLSKCRILKSSGGFEATCDHPSVLTARELCLRLLKCDKAVLTDKQSHLEAHFDLSCLFASNQQSFLYETSSGFERAAYRMDDQIVPEHGRKGIQFRKHENKKVKRRGVPNKHLAPKERVYVHSDEGNGEEEEKRLEAEVPREDDLKTDIFGRRGNGDSPLLDLRHFEVVPIAVVQKKKTEDDIEIQYAVDVGVKRKNKNKKKQCKTPVKENKDCEEIRNMILGCNRETTRGRRFSGDTCT